MQRSRRYETLFLMSLFVFIFATPALADPYTAAIETFKKSPACQTFFKKAYGYAVFPTVGKGGFGVGGAYGKGRVYKQGKVTGTSSLIKATVGFQVGGQAFSEIIFFQDKRAYEEFTNGSFEFDAAASAVAITAGIQGKAGTDGSSASVSAGPQTGKQTRAKYHRGMITFVHIKGGLMYEAAIGGQRFNFKPAK